MILHPMHNPTTNDAISLMYRPIGVLPTASPQPNEADPPQAPSLVGEPACELLCRDGELAALEVFLKEHVCGRRSGSLYVSGPPGTGKSASISHLLDNRPVSVWVYVFLSLSVSLETLLG